MAYKIKNWHQFQHFKDRTPPWIKLYRGLLDDVNFHLLDGDSAKTLIMLWLLASETDGYLPDISVISFRLRVQESYINKSICSLTHWIVNDDDSPISSRYQDDISAISLTRSRETETETYREEKEVEKKDIARSDKKSLRARNENTYRLSFDYSAGQFSGELEAMSEVWAEAYPAVDIAAEIKKAKAWMLSNPKNKKTNIPRFLASWLSRAQDRASNANLPRSGPVTFAEQSRKNTETVIEKLRREAENGQLP